MTKEQLDSILSKIDALLDKNSQTRQLMLELRDTVIVHHEAWKNGHKPDQIKGTVKIDGQSVAYFIEEDGKRRRIDFVDYGYNNTTGELMLQSKSRFKLRKPPQE